MHRPNRARRILHATRAPRAFTLIELLVVVAIIGLLISILLPSLHRARRQSKMVKCQAHLRSLGQALQMYGAEYDDYIPREITQQDAPFAANLVQMLGFDIDTRRRIARQFGDFEFLQCPDFPEGAVDPQTKEVIGDQTLDFVVNGFPKIYESAPADAQREKPNERGRWRPDAIDDNLRPEQLAEVRNTSGIVYLAPAHKYMPSGFSSSDAERRFVYHDFWRGWQLSRGSYPRVAADVRHPAGINLLFFDSHVEARQPKDIDEEDFYFDRH